MSMPSTQDPLDPAALAGLIERLHPQLLAYVRLRMGATLRLRESTSDLAQSICMLALTELPRNTFRSERDVRAFVFELAGHFVVDRARFHQAARRDVGREVALANASSVSDAQLIACYSSICTPSRLAMGREALVRFEAAFERLRPQDQAVILGVCMEGRPHAEVARAMGKSVGAVRVLLLRARDRLRRLMEE